jgi:hypothetical protein
MRHTCRSRPRTPTWFAIRPFNQRPTDPLACLRQCEAVTADTNDLLARVDEFEGLLKTVSAESQTVHDETIAALLQSCVQLDAVFARIDDVEVFKCVAGAMGC